MVKMPGDRVLTTLGAFAMLGGSALFVAWLAEGFQPPTASPLTVSAQLLFLLGWSASVFGLRRIRAAGPGRGQVLLAIQLSLLAVAATQELQDLFLAPEQRIQPMYNAADAAWPLSVIFMLPVGIAVARAGVVRGWHRFVPGFCGVTLPVALLTSFLFGQQLLVPVFGVLTAIAWVTLGYVVLRQGHAHFTQT